MDEIVLRPVGWVRSQRKDPEDDDWDGVEAHIELDAERFEPEALAGLETFSHVEVIFAFHRVPQEKVCEGSRHPRNRPEWPKVGIFAQRGKSRPNRVGLTTCRVARVEGRRLYVRGLDAIDGTPVIDLKPWMSGFEPRGARWEPPWAQELMAGYWS